MVKINIYFFYEKRAKLKGKKVITLKDVRINLCLENDSFLPQK